jgi:hypothetical protein
VTSLREARMAFAVVAVVVLGVTVALGARSGDAPSRPRPPSRPARAVVVGGAPDAAAPAVPRPATATATTTTVTPATPPRRDPAVARDPRPVLRAARAFALAQLRWEDGRRTPATRAALLRLGDARLARAIVDAPPPRATPGGFRPPAGEAVQGADLSDDQPARGVAVVVTVGQGTALRAQRLTLRRHGSAWRVTALG